MAPFSSFPCEIVSLIVENIEHRRRDLVACTHVNRQFYKATNPILWRFPALTKETIVKQFLDGLAAATVSYQFSVARWVQKLTLYDDCWTDDRLLILMEHDLSQLEELRLVWARKLTDASLPFLPYRCPNIKTLYLQRVPHLTPLFIDAVSLYCPRLVRFEVSECGELDADTFAALRNCRLQTISVELPHQPMWNLILHYPYLTHLNLQGFINELLFAADTAWPYLESLSLNGYYGRSRARAAINSEDDALLRFLKYHPGIERLYLREPDIDDQYLDAMADLGLPCLTELTIIRTPRLSSTSIRRLIHSCPQLGLITFWGSKITRQEFPETGAGVEHSSRCNQGENCDIFVHHLDFEDIHKVRSTAIRSSQEPIDLGSNFSRLSIGSDSN